jgi:hypothetical protein
VSMFHHPSAPRHSRQTAARWATALLTLCLLVPTVAPPETTAQTSCPREQLLDIAGCRLTLGASTRQNMTSANEQHKWRLEITQATNLLLKLYTRGSDYDLLLVKDGASGEKITLAEGRHEERPIDPFVVRYLERGSYYVYVQGPRQPPPDAGYILYASELDREFAPAAPEGPITVDSVRDVMELSLFNQRGLPWDVAFSPDGKLLAVAVSSLGELGEQESLGGTGVLRDYGVKIWDLTLGLQVNSLMGGGEAAVLSVGFSPDGQWLAAGWGNNVVVWAVGASSEFRGERRLRGHAREITDLAFSPGHGRALLASGDVDGRVNLWDVDSGGLVRSLGAHGNEVSGIAFSPNGRLLATASHDGRVKLWDVDTGSELASVSGGGTAAMGLDFAADGQLLAAAFRDGTVRLWQVAGEATSYSLTPIAGLESPGTIALNARFSPDGRLLVSSHAPVGSDVVNPEQDGTEIRVWDVARRRQIHALQRIYSHAGLAFSPTGNLLASTGSDRVVALWGAFDPIASGGLFRWPLPMDPHVLLKDSFDDPEAAQLPRAAADETRSVRKYAGGEYVLQNLDPKGGLPIAIIPGTYADAALAVDARVAGDPKEQFVSLGCRRSPGDAGTNHYRFSIAPAIGHFQLSRWDNGTSTALVPWKADGAIRRGRESNRLELRCRDASIIASVNGRQVAAVEDATHRRGEFWIGAEGSAEVRFDNLVVFLQ